MAPYDCSSILLTFTLSILFFQFSEQHMIEVWGASWKIEHPQCHKHQYDTTLRYKVRTDGRGRGAPICPATASFLYFPPLSLICEASITYCPLFKSNLTLMAPCMEFQKPCQRHVAKTTVIFEGQKCSMHFRQFKHFCCEYHSFKVDKNQATWFQELQRKVPQQ